MATTDYLLDFAECDHRRCRPIMGNPKFVARCLDCGAAYTCGG